MGGTIAIPSYFVLTGEMTSTKFYVAMVVFVSVFYVADVLSFNGSMIKGKSLCRSIKDAIWALFCYFLGGLILFIGGILIENRLYKVMGADVRLL